MYHPSGIGTAFCDRTHSPSTLWYTRLFIIGPTRIGVDSLTNTVLPQPLANAITSAAKSIAVNAGIHSRLTSRNSAIQPRDKGQDNLRDDSLEHGAFSEYQSS